jgi:hypothetical protein
VTSRGTFAGDDDNDGGLLQSSAAIFSMRRSNLRPIRSSSSSGTGSYSGTASALTRTAAVVYVVEEKSGARDVVSRVWEGDSRLR